MAATILIVDDEPDIRELIGEILADEEYRTVLAADAGEARRLRESERPDMILLDVWMPDTDGISLLREWREAGGIDCPVVMISGHGSVEAAVEATRHGAVDFIEKPIAMARLLDTVRKTLARGRPPVLPAEDRRSPPPAREPTGRSPAIEQFRARIEAVAATACNVLIQGEAGSGRTYAARWLLARSPITTAARIEIACDPDIFRPGHDDLLRQAEHGPVAVILDRIELLDESAQAALLKLMERAAEALRVVAVAGPRLEQKRARGEFDSGLFHRLSESRVEVPPLRQRREDIPELARQFAEELPESDRLPYRAIPVAAQNRLRQHHWHGNLHELRNTVRELLLTGSDRPVDVEELDQLLAAPVHQELGNDAHTALFELPLREAREAFERQYLIARLKQAEGSVGQLAEAVEMERTHLYRKLRQLGIDPKQVIEGD
jgi:DNA-binding NtrC family response regulator